ncbi:transmembrane protein 256 homolog isoform X2 [Episyrphus balteatus]|uniref:transmembrane protein 256 homolog isoform X2 n=1 Tax=Episyrphus balteatus TaxID=286459 RepID=UPI0024869F00|nr:transmembrane protein 256 homolog isoform X2 [Episyrphus balteatus]
MSSLGDALGYLAFKNPISQAVINTTYSLAKSTSNVVAKTTADTAKMVTNALPLWRLAGGNYNFVRLAGASGAAAVILGAIGSHRTLAIQDKGESKAIFETANRFHFFHSIALMAVPLAKRPVLTGSLMATGTLLFSGVLYYRALSGEKTLSRLAPMGGFCLIVAWLTLLL